ncbi:MAG: hypothetical protein N3D10_00175 [Candidatus Micrarchaeota archaeon]|nr:hypothetical protein [Candidatus Micrarchaeota archaeon]
MKKLDLKTFSSLLFLFLYLFVSLLFSQTSDPTQELANQLSQICKKLHDLIPTLAILLVIFGAFVYAAGQIFSAETRAKATAWATSCIAGAIIGILIAQILPSFLGAIIGQDISCGP